MPERRGYALKEGHPLNSVDAVVRLISAGKRWLGLSSSCKRSSKNELNSIVFVPRILLKMNERSDRGQTRQSTGQTTGGLTSLGQTSKESV